jgi:malate dehydrogenase (oxaloacetate-decarboxylating)
MNYSEESIKRHKECQGKWGMHATVPLETRDDLGLAYTPGVGAVSMAIAEDKSRVRELTMKGHTVAIISDGSAVLGLGNIGPEAALPVMEGKAILFKKFANIDGIPLVLDTQDPQEIIKIVRALAPTFGGINLEDIAAPACFVVEDALQDLGIPVFHDDQHGTAIVVLASLINASRVVGKKIEDMKIVINGSGAAGIAVAKLLGCIDQEGTVCRTAGNLLVCDSQGIISSHREELNTYKQNLLTFTNPQDLQGTLQDALQGADCFIGVSKGNILTPELIGQMGTDPIIFALANPIPEIMPDIARAAGAAVVGTGRSDFPNQINNVLAFPGIFKGALESGAARITPAMKIAAAYALAAMVPEPHAESLLPDVFNPAIADVIAEAVKGAI